MPLRPWARLVVAAWMIVGLPGWWWLLGPEVAGAFLGIGMVLAWDVAQETKP